MADDVEKQLLAQMQVQTFALQIDELTLSDNEAILITYVRLLKVDKLKEEMLFIRKLKTPKVRHCLKKLGIISFTKYSTRKYNGLCCRWYSLYNWQILIIYWSF